jgi:hypothetical protein
MQRRLRAFETVYALSRWARRRFTPAGMAVLCLLTAAAVLGLDTQRTAAYQIFGLTAGLIAVASLGALRLRARPDIRYALVLDTFGGPEFEAVCCRSRPRSWWRCPCARPCLTCRRAPTNSAR